MLDDDKPRRSSAECWAEITGLEESRHAAADAALLRPSAKPSLGELVAQMKAADEAALLARERAETASEVAESERICRVEAEIEAEIPLLRAREMRRTFFRSGATQAATTSS